MKTQNDTNFADLIHKMDGGKSKDKSHGTAIHVPPELPEILKQFTKTAIKVQPPDVLAWSAAYFRALATGEAKEGKWQKKGTALTPSLLRVLNKQLGPLKEIPISVINEKWIGVALPQDQFDALVQKGGLGGEVEWTKFFGLSCLSLSDNVTEAMTLACDILSTELDGRVPYSLFIAIYRYLAIDHCKIAAGHVDHVTTFLDDNYAKKQNGYVMPKNFLRSDCPNLSG